MIRIKVCQTLSREMLNLLTINLVCHKKAVILIQAFFAGLTVILIPPSSSQIVSSSHQRQSLLYDGAGIAERVSALDWLSLRYAAIITLPVSNPGLCPQARHFIILASSVDRDVNGGPVGRN